MNREIKFRGWFQGINGTEMWVYGYLVKQTNGNWGITNGETSWTVDNVGQFTGCFDKNGTEIYEGDYLVDRFPIDEEDLSKGYNESLLPVVWCEKQLMWCVDASFAKVGSYLTSLVEYFGEHLEVKGNIHERS